MELAEPAALNLMRKASVNVETLAHRGRINLAPRIQAQYHQQLDRRSRLKNSSCAVSDHTSTHLDIWFAIDDYDLSPGQPIAISKPANFKVLVSQCSPTAQVGLS